MAQQAATRGAAMNRSQNTLQALSKKQKDYVSRILANFLDILKLIKVDEDRNTPVRIQMAEQEQLEMSIRAVNIAHCAENLLNLCEDLKKLFFLNDFPFISQTVQKAREAAIADIKETQARMVFIHREMETELFDLEEEYGSLWYLKNQDPFQSDLTDGEKT